MLVLCMDYDGGLVESGHPGVKRRNLQAIKKWRKAGNVFVLMTGRNISVLRQKFPQWAEEVDFMVTDGGGAIFKNNRKPLEVQPLDQGLVLCIERLAGMNVQPAYYTVKGYGIDYPLKLDLIKLRLWFLTEKEALIAKGKLEAHFDSRIQVLPWFRKGYSPLPGVDLSQFAGFLDIVSSGAGKQNAVKRIAKRLGVDSANIITVGNDYNDVAMLRAYQGYAVDGSDIEVVQAAQGRTIASAVHLIRRIML